jgi:hypothetical protein
MIVGTILLTKTNKYVDANGNLPKRPRHDKELLASLIAKSTLVSEEGYEMLPLSMQRTCCVSTNKAKSYIPITIRELAQAELLIVSRSQEDFEGGKEFRLDNFKCLVKDRKVEIWITIN